MGVPPGIFNVTARFKVVMRDALLVKTHVAGQDMSDEPLGFVNEAFPEKKTYAVVSTFKSLVFLPRSKVAVFVTIASLPSIFAKRPRGRRDVVV